MNENTRDAAGNFAVVGGTSGIGAELSRRLLANGHAVWVLSRREHNVPEGAQWVEWDATASDLDTATLPKELNGLAYCPGSIRLKPFRQLKDADYREDFEVNVLGAVRAIRPLLPLLKASGQGAVVLFSTVAVRAGMPYHASVAAAKGAVEGLVRALAAELAPAIRVNAVAPSLVATPLSERLLGSEEKRAAAAQRHPLGRVGEAADVAAAAEYLLSTRSSWVSGQILGVDGGMSALRQLR